MQVYIYSISGESETNLSSTECVPPDPSLNNSFNKVNSKHTTFTSVSERVSCAIRSLGLEQRHTSREHSKSTSTKTTLLNNQGETKRPANEKCQEASSTHIIINMDEAEEVTTLLDDEEDDYSSDTSDDLHKVRRLNGSQIIKNAEPSEWVATLRLLKTVKSHFPKNTEVLLTLI